MSAFKDAVQGDVNAVFLSVDEFADEHDIDGHSVVCIIDTDALQDVQRLSGGAHLEGVFVSACVLYVAEDAMAAALRGLPVVGQQFLLDGKRQTVTAVKRESGMLEVSLEVYEQ